jgi:hypothetical protein
MKPCSIGLALLLVAAAPPLAMAQQPEDMTINGQVKIGVHKFKLDTDHVYQFEVKGKNFAPNVSISGFFGFFNSVTDFGKEPNTFRSLFLPLQAKEHALLVLPNHGSTTVPESLLDYTVTLKTMAIDKTPVLKKEDKLANTDLKYANPKVFYKTHFKAYPIAMKAGRLYVIDMIVKKAAGNQLVSYLVLEDAKKAVLASDNNSGGYPNARIMFRPTSDGENTVIATSQSDITAIGDFTLLIRFVTEKK